MLILIGLSILGFSFLFGLNYLWYMQAQQSEKMKKICTFFSMYWCVTAIPTLFVCFVAGWDNQKILKSSGQIIMILGIPTLFATLVPTIPVLWKKLRGRSSVMCTLCFLSFACTPAPEGREWHIMCHSEGNKIYDDLVKENLVLNRTDMGFIEKSSGEQVYVSGNCIIRAEKIQSPTETLHPDR